MARETIADVEDSLAETSDSEGIQSDAFVFFGATGDLAYKKIIPSLYNLVRRGTLSIPVIGIANSGWSLDQLKERARSSILAHGTGLDDAIFTRFMKQLNYIDGDYRDPYTFSRLSQLLGTARSPAHYLAIPPSLFSVVTQGLRQADCADGARIIVEKPFGRDLASSRMLNATLHQAFPESRIF